MASRWPLPPLLYLAAIVISVLLHALWPLPWIGSPIGDLLVALGGLCVFASIAIAISALRALQRGKTPLTGGQAAHLVTNGAYSFSRNPLYLACTLLMIGIGLIFGIAWFLPLSLLAATLTYLLAIKREEAHLTQRFGKRYHDYARRVRRWI